VEPQVKLRVGLVGVGDAWQQRHAPALRALADRFELRAICDQIGHRAEQAAAEFGAAAVDGYQVLTRREDLDTILILAPQWYGPLPILAACDAKKAVYCGTGLDLSPEEADLIKRRVEQTGVVFMAELLRRQTPATLRLKELIATRLGPPRLLFCHQRSAGDGRTAPLTEQQLRHAAFGDLIELVDWCRYIIGCEPTSVTGVIHHSGHSPGEEDYFMMSLDFSNSGQPGTGSVAQISSGRYVPAGWDEAITYRPLAALQVACERGIAFVDLPSTLVWFDEAGRHQESLESERPVGEQLLAQFHRAVTGEACQTCDLDDAYRALRIVQQARKSHQDGRRLKL
jgi:predicted dehydrogenase